MASGTSSSTPAPPEAVPVAAATPDRSYLLDKLHSLSGLVPIGAFLAEHFWSNSYALVSPRRYDWVSYELQTIPWRPVVEWALIFLPLLYHALYGFVIWSRGQSNVLRYPYVANWMYVLQRWTGLIAFLFIGWHVYVERILTGGKSTYADVATTMASPLYWGFYLIGVLATSFHFGNGLWQFANKWGLAVGPRAQRRAAWIGAFVGLLFALVGVLIVLGFHFQWRPFEFYEQR
jgi:succinate dehydrogenase / fumarate reductase cytochrome b subunit